MHVPTRRSRHSSYNLILLRCHIILEPDGFIPLYYNLVFLSWFLSVTKLIIEYSEHSDRGQKRSDRPTNTSIRVICLVLNKPPSSEEKTVKLLPKLSVVNISCSLTVYLLVQPTVLLHTVFLYNKGMSPFPFSLPSKGESEALVSSITERLNIISNKIITQLFTGRVDPLVMNKVNVSCKIGGV